MNRPLSLAEAAVRLSRPWRSILWSVLGPVLSVSLSVVAYAQAPSSSTSASQETQRSLANVIAKSDWFDRVLPSLISDRDSVGVRNFEQEKAEVHNELVRLANQVVANGHEPLRKGDHNDIGRAIDRSEVPAVLALMETTLHHYHIDRQRIQLELLQQYQDTQDVNTPNTEISDVTKQVSPEYVLRILLFYNRFAALLEVLELRNKRNEIVSRETSWSTPFGITEFLFGLGASLDATRRMSNNSIFDSQLEAQRRFVSHLERYVSSGGRKPHALAFHLTNMREGQFAPPGTSVMFRRSLVNEVGEAYVDLLQNNEDMQGHKVHGQGDDTGVDTRSRVLDRTWARGLSDAEFRARSLVRYIDSQYGISGPGGRQHAWLSPQARAALSSSWLKLGTKEGVGAISRADLVVRSAELRGVLVHIERSLPDGLATDTKGYCRDRLASINKDFAEVDNLALGQPPTSRVRKALFAGGELVAAIALLSHSYHLLAGDSSWSEASGLGSEKFAATAQEFNRLKEDVTVADLEATFADLQRVIDRFLPVYERELQQAFPKVPPRLNMATYLAEIL